MDWEKITQILSSPLAVALLSSGTISSIFLWWFKRNDKIADIKKTTDRQAEGIAVLTEGFLILLEALHKQKLINGESEHCRKDLENYLLKNTKNGLYTKTEDK